MYSIQDRNYVQNLIIELSKNDTRITDCAIVGSESVGENDKFSDIDLTFGVKNDINISQILNEWNDLMSERFDANVLFDLPYEESIYRVYLLPNALQVDLSFTPHKNFGAITTRFKLLFGQSSEREQKRPPELPNVFGYCVLYALKSRCSTERKKYRQSFHYLNELRNNLMILKCLTLKTNPFDGRSYDELPISFLNKIKRTLAKDVKQSDLNNSLKNLTTILTEEAELLNTLKYKFEDELKLISAVSTSHNQRI